MNQVGATSPKDPTPDAEPYLWPTNKVFYNMKIQMSNGEIWSVKPMPVLNGDGSISITLKRPTTQVMTTKITVAAADVHTRIWWGVLEYVADPEEGTTEPLPPEPGQPVPLPGGGTPPTNPPPSDPPVDPSPGV